MAKFRSNSTSAQVCFYNTALMVCKCLNLRFWLQCVTTQL